MAVVFQCPACADSWTFAQTTDAGQTWTFTVHYQGVAERRACPLSGKPVPGGRTRKVLA